MVQAIWIGIRLIQGLAGLRALVMQTCETRGCTPLSGQGIGGNIDRGPRRRARMTVWYPEIISYLQQGRYEYEYFINSPNPIQR